MSTINLINNLNQSYNNYNTSSDKVSSGDKIYKAQLDPANLSISERMDSAISGSLKEMETEQSNISLNQTAEGGLSVIQDSMQRIYELAVQSKNGTLTSDDRANIQKEVVQLKENINYIANSTEYNTQQILAFATTERFNIQNLDVTNQGDLNLDSIKEAINSVSSMRSEYGSKINASESRIKELQAEHYSMTESYSAIRDVDLAREVTEMTKFKMQQEINISMIKKQNDSSLEKVRSLLGL